MNFDRHAFRIVLIMAFAAGILGWTASRTPVIWADGLRYIGQAKEIERGLSKETLARAVDHPAYPLAIASIHRLIGNASPASWQFAGQLAALISAVLLVIPLYLVTLEVFGETAAWMAALLSFLVPIPGHVFADALSEATFLLIWMWGIWFALRFLKEGNPIWIPPIVAASGVAYLTRPEGLLLPVAVVATLAVMPLMPSIRLSWSRWWIAITLLVLGPALLAAPFVAIRGGIGTKPAVARLLGLAPKAPGMAVERDRPVAEDQPAVLTFALSVRAMSRAVAEAVTFPLLALLPGGILAARERENRRSIVFIGIVVAAWIVALVRLHATGGYCTARHALIAALPLIASGAAGLAWSLRSSFEWLQRSGKLAGVQRARLEPLCAAVVLVALGVWWSPRSLAPLNQGYLGYRQAGEWLAAHSEVDAKVFDLKGWAIFYSEHPGYSFSRIGEGSQDRSVRWLVAHDSLLTGPWFYCDIVRNMVQGREPVESFPKLPERGVARVHIFDLSSSPRAEPAEVASQPTKSRQVR